MCPRTCCKLWLAVVVLLSQPLSLHAQGESFFGETEVVPSDEHHELFGRAVDLEGDRLVVGAPWRSDGIGNAGATYVFQRDAAGHWQQLVRLAASDAEFHAWLGWSVALDGDRFVAGAPNQNRDDLLDVGAAYVFERDAGGQWLEVAKLIPSDGAEGDQFGWSVALDGDRVIVGSRDADLPAPNAGAAYVFERDAGGTWLEAARFSASDTATGDDFGESVALQGERLVVGAFAHDGADENSGAAYVFEPSPEGEWQEVARLAASDEDGFDRFGASVALDGESVVVGATGAGESGEGAAYLFTRDANGQWQEAARLVSDDPEEQITFGGSVDLEGSRVAVGDPSANSFTGAVFLFEPDAGGEWRQVWKLVASDAETSGTFGDSVALDGSRVAVGDTEN